MTQGKIRVTFAAEIRGNVGLYFAAYSCEAG